MKRLAPRDLNWLAVHYGIGKRGVRRRWIRELCVGLAVAYDALEIGLRGRAAQILTEYLSLSDILIWLDDSLVEVVRFHRLVHNGVFRTLLTTRNIPYPTIRTITIVGTVSV